MPQYSFKCDVCHALESLFCSMHDVETVDGQTKYAGKDAPVCCGKTMPREYSVQFTRHDSLYNYRSVLTGEMITDRAQHREHLKRHGCEEVGSEKLSEKLAKEKRKSDMAEMKSIRNSIEQAISTL